MLPPFPSPVAKWHNAAYDAINPTRPELSIAGKTVVITGGGTGIGKETAFAFALAGAKYIHIIGRRQSMLEEAKKYVEDQVATTTVYVHVADVSDVVMIERVAEEIAHWDVLVSNAGYFPKKSSLEKVDLVDWWAGFEINLKGAIILARAFLPRRKPNAVLINNSSSIVTFTAAEAEGASSYQISKLATVKVFETIAIEYPDVQVLSVHPGVVRTAMNKTAGFEDLPFDDIQLPAYFTVWAASPEAKFARGRFLWCNWDVEQLKGLKNKFEGDEVFQTTGIVGWPYTDANV